MTNILHHWTDIIHHVFDRECSRKPRLTGGVKGHNIIKQFLTGELRPVGGELHSFMARIAVFRGRQPPGPCGQSGWGREITFRSKRLVPWTAGIGGGAL